MLPVTRERQPNHVLRMGARVPPDSVNLAYTYAPSLSPQENLTIVDLSGFIPENASSGRQDLLRMSPDASHILRDQEGKAEIGSRSFFVTNVFLNDEPLFFAHELRYYLYDAQGPDRFGFYHGTAVVLTDIDGQLLPPQFRYRIALLKAGPPDGGEAYRDLYRVLVYTSFQTNGIANYRVHYNAVEVVQPEAGAPYRAPRAGFTEVLNPQPAFSRVQSLTTIMDPANIGLPLFYRASGSQFGRSKVYVPRGRMQDIRQPVKFDYCLEVQYGPAENRQTFKTAPTAATVLNPASVLPREKALYVNGYLVLTTTDTGLPANVADVVRPAAEAQGILELPDAVYSVRGPETAQVILTCPPNGSGPALATTLADTEPTRLEAPEAYEWGADGDLVPSYAVLPADGRQIRPLMPAETDPGESWYLRVQNGFFRRAARDQTDSYYLPEYFRQPFDPGDGMPYRTVENERPQIIGQQRIRVRYTPLFVKLNDDKQPQNLEIRINDVDATGLIQGWDVGDGTIYLSGTVQETDRILVRYCYEESFLTYRGFWDEETGRFWHLDLNPGPGHTITMADSDGVIKELPTYRLLNRTIYLYLKPAVRVSAVGKTTQHPHALFHTFAKLPEFDGLLLAEILVRPNALKQSVQILDTRVRGGGLKAEITESMIKDLEPEARFYWDIGYWDGRPFQENSVLVVRLSRQVLREFGGRFTRDEVRTIVQKHTAWGTLPIIEYVDDELVVQRPENLTVDVVDIPEPRPVTLAKPRMRVEVANVSPN